MTATLEAMWTRARASVDHMERQASQSLPALTGDSFDVGSLVASRQGQRSGLFGDPAQSRARVAYSQYRHWVYVATTAVAKRVAGQSWKAGEIVGATDNPLRKGVKRYSAKAVGKTGEIEEFPEHHVLDVLDQPNPIQGHAEFLMFASLCLQLTGESYWIGGITDESSIEVWAVPTHWIRPKHDEALFSSFELVLPGQVEGIPIPPENVARTFLPDPSDPKCAKSPLDSCVEAVTTDRYIQQTQRQSFELGLTPNVVVTMGKTQPDAEGKPAFRPWLRGPQRAQLIRAIREVWRQSVNMGDPAIVDGMIESVHKLTNTPQEMDWGTSGEIVKQRIFQAYAVNPIVTGELVPTSKAQALVAERNVADYAVNPELRAFSKAMTNFVGPMYAKPERLCLWLPDVVIIDKDQRLREWTSARSQGDVTRDEYRSAILDLPGLEGVVERPQILNTVGGMQGAVSVLSAVGQGLLTRDSAAKVFELFFDLEPPEAMALVGKEQLVPRVPPQLPPPMSPQEEEDEEEGETKSRPFFVKGLRDITKQIHAAQYEATEHAYQLALEKHFASVVKKTVAAVRKTKISIVPENSVGTAEAILLEAYDEDAAFVDLMQESAPAMIRAFLDGARAEHWHQKNIGLRPKWSAHKSTAQEIADRLGIIVPGGVPGLPEMLIGLELPEWMVEIAIDTLKETFEQDYWQKIPSTTRGDIKTVLASGIEDGWSIRRISNEIMLRRGAEYNRHRAKNVARSESGAMLNAGHSSGIEHLAAETGLDIRKEWLSVLGPTTRVTHAAMDGTLSDENGMFDFHGQLIPYPGHHSLSAGERCNCQCTTVSAIAEFNPSEQSGQARTQSETGTAQDIAPKQTEERCSGLKTSYKAGSSCDLSKSEIAKTYAKRVGKEVQRYSEERNESDLASELGKTAKSLDDNQPHDVEWRDRGMVHGIELKTMVSNKHSKLTMKRSAMNRKASWVKKTKGRFHTVVFDDHAVIPGKGIDDKTKALNQLLENNDDSDFDFGARKMFYRRGYGSFRVNGMHEIKDIKELRKLMRMDVADLPEGAG